jgi:Rrf2 family protein
MRGPENLPMSVSSKCYYAIRAIYALSEHPGPEPMKIAEIAEKEKIPIRFLEVILSQLKGRGFVKSRRGADGGYLLARSADSLTVGEVMRSVDGPIAPVDCVSKSRPTECEFHGACHFYPFWGRVRQAISDVVDRTTFADLVRENRERERAVASDWSI